MATEDQTPEADPPKSQTPPPSTAVPTNNGENEAAAEFKRRVADKQAGLDDYDPEEELWNGGYSPKAMVGTWILMAVASIGAIVASFLVVGFTLPIAIGIAFVIWIIGVARYIWRRLGYHYQLTSQRFVHKTGLLTRQTDRIEVIDIDDVSYKQGPVQRAMGVGTIYITSSDRSHPELTMIGIDKVADVAGLIDDIRRTERRKRSLHIESI